MATRKRSSWQHYPGGQMESRISDDDDDDDYRPQKGAEKMFYKSCAGFLAKEGVEMIFEAIRRGNEEKTMKALEYKRDETSQELKETAKALQDCLKELRESRQHERELFRAYLEKNQGRGNEEKTTKDSESKRDEASQEHMRTLKALQECLNELEESRQRERQLRARLEKKQAKKEEENPIAELISQFRQLSQRFETLEERLQKSPESS
ncbi:stress response protein NST1-like [Pyrgilauda ruficollis]|uniref:stress response protein NST1-like n=1 Tax=Pyrgilauda ruficollis TaxID=221976 RepID=UPI001B884D57|nr:stress response protein NST1-like [Pyrgilauda ruficollis]